MCLTVTAETPRFRKAKKDIVVWKVIKKNNKSKYKFFQYRAKTYKLISPMQVEHDHSVHQGFHSYVRFDDADYDAAPDEKVVKCIIPKRTRYISGDFCDARNYVSEKLRVVSLKDRQTCSY